MRSWDDQRRILVAMYREPLVHCLFAGMLLYGLFELTSQRGDWNPHRIVVTESALVAHILSGNPRMSAGQAADQLRKLSRTEKDALVEAWIREEVLVREARRLGLDMSDYAERRRLVGRLKYVQEGFLRDSIQPDEETLRRWHRDHRQNYMLPAAATFTHVFFDVGEFSGSAFARADGALAALNGQRVGYSAATGLGDRFLYHRNYVRAEAQTLASHFGGAFVKGLSELEVNAERWQGPLRSKFGLHLVLLTAFEEERIAEFDEVRARVERDFVAAEIDQNQRRLYVEARQRYDVDVEVVAVRGTQG